MVQGLAFLSKKSWHTKNLANQEKVWMAEQQKAAEESKTKELARQIAQEREEEELDRISGKKSNRLDRGIDWMYQGGAGEAAQEEAKKQAEEYLLGKEYVPEGGGKGGDFDQFENTGINTVIGGAQKSELADTQSMKAPPPDDAAGSVMRTYDEGPSVADRNESFRMRHEDPMFVVSQKQREKTVQVEKKKALYERVVGTVDTHSDRREARKLHKAERKAAKKERKRQRKRERPHRRDGDDYGERKRRHRSRTRSRSREREWRQSDRETEYGERDSHRRRRSHSRSQSWERPERRKLDSYSSEDSYGRSRQGTDRKRRYGDPVHDDDKTKPSGYGLQGATKTSGISCDDIGPRRDLLNKRRQVQESARQRARGKASTRRRMTDEERTAALRDMQSNAEQREADLSNAVSRKRQSGMEDEDRPGKGEASFLNDVHHVSSNIAMSSRVAQNRHTNQNVNESFL